MSCKILSCRIFSKYFEKYDKPENYASYISKLTYIDSIFLNLEHPNRTQASG